MVAEQDGAVKVGDGAVSALGHFLQAAIKYTCKCVKQFFLDLNHPTILSATSDLQHHGWLARLASLQNYQLLSVPSCSSQGYHGTLQSLGSWRCPLQFGQQHTQHAQVHSISDKHYSGDRVFHQLILLLQQISPTRSQLLPNRLCPTGLLLRLLRNTISPNLLKFLVTLGKDHLNNGSFDCSSSVTSSSVCCEAAADVLLRPHHRIPVDPAPTVDLDWARTPSVESSSRKGTYNGQG